MDPIDFDLEWLMLADHGLVDGLGGAEYRRVRLAWWKAGQPEDDVRAFILDHVRTATTSV